MDKEGGNTKQKAVVQMPEDIMTEILLKLPVESLLKCKTVCKSWYSIINSTMFIKEHLKLARVARYNQHKNFFSILIPNEYASYPCVLYKEDSYGITHAKTFDCPYKLFVGHDENEVPIKVCNSCDGLICFIIPRHHRILIWNPSLPTEYMIVQFQRISYLETVVIGYDRTSDDYKIVKLPSGCPVYEDYISVGVFSLKRNSWRSKIIHKRNSVHYFTSSFIYANNGFYWIATQCYEENKKTDCILYFDLAKESLDYINSPSKRLICLVVMNYKESIVIAGENFEGQHELWVLEEYCGMKSSWNKISSFNFIAPLFSDYSTFTLNGEILVHEGKCWLSKYNIKDGSRKPVVAEGDKVTYNECPCSFFASPYIESLVSPKQLQ